MTIKVIMNNITHILMSFISLDLMFCTGLFLWILKFTPCDYRWDLKAIDRLPYYMQICFLALNNFVNEMAFDILKEQEFNVIQYLRKVV